MSVDWYFSHFVFSPFNRRWTDRTYTTLAARCASNTLNWAASTSSTTTTRAVITLILRCLPAITIWMHSPWPVRDRLITRVTFSLPSLRLCLSEKSFVSFRCSTCLIGDHQKIKRDRQVLLTTLYFIFVKQFTPKYSGALFQITST